MPIVTTKISVGNRLGSDGDEALVPLAVPMLDLLTPETAQMDRGVSALTSARTHDKTLVFCALSYFALKEFFSIVPTRQVDRRAIFWAYLTIPFQYYWVATDWYGMFIIFIPVYAFLIIPTRLLLTGETSGFKRLLWSANAALQTHFPYRVSAWR